MDSQLYQLADSGLPTGGFVFSTGMEAAFTLGWIKTPKELFDYCLGVVHSYSHSELKFLAELYDALFRSAEEFQGKVDWYLATLSSGGARKASLLQGRSWSQLFKNLFGEDYTLKGQVHFLPQLVYGLFRMNKEKEDVLAFAFFLFCRDQLSAAVRLGVCGPMESQKILQQLLKMESRVLDLVFQDFEPQKTAVAWEVCQGMHSRVYSTLFQN